MARKKNKHTRENNKHELGTDERKDMRKRK